MEVDEIQTQACKFSRVGNGRTDSTKIGLKGGEQYPDDDDEGEVKRGGGGGGGGTDGGRLRGWHHSSRIFRVSRASGGKDRHSKVLTSKGLRDRRVRLSVTTAIQFYDLQDRLGFDQPSKAVEWLIKAASEAIAELPSLNSPFPDTPKQPSDEKRPSPGAEQGFDSVELEGEQNYQHQHTQQHISLSKSACSSTSETSKGSGLSLSRTEIRDNRVKARERARERAAKEKKEKESESRAAHPHDVNNPIPQSSSFTELLTGGIGCAGNNATSVQHNSSGEPNLFHKLPRQWTSTPMDYFGPGYLGSSSSRINHSSGFAGPIHLGNSLPHSPFNVGGDHHPEPQPFSFVPEHFIPVAAASQPGSSDYNLNFTISSGLAGFNRGTLQSNSPALLPQFQRFSPIDASNIPCFMGAATSGAAPVENNHHHHQFPPALDGRLQLYYDDGRRHSDQKGKGKN